MNVEFYEIMLLFNWSEIIKTFEKNTVLMECFLRVYQ